MSDFAPWLRNHAAEDGELARLQEFVDSHSRDWPYYSNKLSDFMRVIIVARDKNEIQLLDALERYYLAWRNSARTYASGFWSNFGPLALFLVGMIATLFLMYRIYAPSLLASLADTGQAHGLLTFLLAFAATSVIVAGAIGILWMDKSDISSGFGKAKDVSTVLTGVLGTIAVFYFASVFGPAPVRPPVPAALASVPAAAAAAPAAVPAPAGSGALPAPTVQAAAPPAEAPSLLPAAPAPLAPAVTSPDHALPAAAAMSPVPMASMPNRHHGRP